MVLDLGRGGSECGIEHFQGRRRRRPCSDDPAHHQDDFSGIYDSGAHFCYCDGSVSFISENINKAVFQSFATIQGGESVFVDQN